MSHIPPLSSNETSSTTKGDVESTVADSAQDKSIATIWERISNFIANHRLMSPSLLEKISATVQQHRITAFFLAVIAALIAIPVALIHHAVMIAATTAIVATIIVIVIIALILGGGIMMCRANDDHSKPSAINETLERNRRYGGD